MNLVPEQSGMLQVGEHSEGWQELTSELVLTQTGYVAVFMSNLSSQTVQFDNFLISLYKGKLLEETHYYPFGLPMDDVVLTEGTLHDNIRYKYQGNEFIKELGLHWMDFHARQYDPQIGRFLGIDPLADWYGQHVYSPYSAMGNAPSHFIDPNGESFQDAFMRANAGASENPNDWLKGSPGDLASRENFGSGDEDRFLGLYRNNGPGAGGGIGIDELALNAWNQAAFTYTKFRFNAYGKMYESIATNDLTEFLDTESGVTIVYNLSGRFKSVEGLNDMYDNVQGALNKFTLQSSASKGWDATNTTFGAFGLAIGAKITMLEGGAALNREMGISKVNKISMIRTYGAEGAKYMKYAKGLGVVASLFTTGYSVGKAIDQYNVGGWSEVRRHRDAVDAGVGIIGLGATGLAYFGLISNPVGWGVGVGILIYGGATLIYDAVNND